ncbi:XTP/dITP diphosphohydrolase [Propionicimonas paludicola]|uniref:XTP/dITP diphosphohydrolase n=1 Tax=Propionicimonas paludicola TaxID=185243 RepID=A0A2A9CSG7_9ACTN|nr:MazG family protein [Propionicimonas paludicola]PFG17387.1 XTP/dITP diphosphohydrolase [Propionicimonas paludicola]
MSDHLAELDRLVAVMHRLRSDCPWDAQQTHESLIHYLVEETMEVVEAIEAGADDQLVEELGDLLLQVIFHAEIAAETGRFTIAEVARGISDKLIARHPYVFSEAEVPADLMGSWEQAKAAEKHRTSALDGIPQRLSALSRAHKVIGRAASHGITLPPPSAAVSELEQAELGAAFVHLAQRAVELGLDPEQVARAAVREVEAQIQAAEQSR